MLRLNVFTFVFFKAKTRKVSVFVRTSFPSITNLVCLEIAMLSHPHFLNFLILYLPYEVTQSHECLSYDCVTVVLFYRLTQCLHRWARRKKTSCGSPESFYMIYQVNYEAYSSVSSQESTACRMEMTLLLGRFSSAIFFHRRSVETPQWGITYSMETRQPSTARRYSTVFSIPALCFSHQCVREVPGSHPSTRVNYSTSWENTAISSLTPLVLTLARLTLTPELATFKRSIDSWGGHAPTCCRQPPAHWPRQSVSGCSKHCCQKGHTTTHLTKWCRLTISDCRL